MEKANLIIDQATAKRLYPNAGQEVRAVFEATFGKGTFSQKITDRVKTFQDACEIVGINPDAVEVFEGEDEKAYFKLKTIIRALNEGWKPNYYDDNQPKWYPWFYMNRTGFRLGGCYCGRAVTIVGARLVFKSEELARYSTTQFLDIYKAFYAM